MFPISLLSYAIDDVEKLAKPLTVGLLIALLTTGVLLYFFKRTALPTFWKALKIFGAVYFFLLAAVLFITDAAYHYDDSYLEENYLDKQALLRFVFLPVCLFFALFLGSAVGFSSSKRLQPQTGKRIRFILALIVCAALVITLGCLYSYYRLKIENDGYYNSDEASVNKLALWISAVIFTAAVLSLGCLDKKKLELDSKALAYAGVTLAMSFSLSYIKLWDMPYGGSITLVSLLPLSIYSYAFGLKKGLFAGFSYGLLQALQDPWIIHPAQFLLDYPVAFTCIGLSGIFKKQTEGKTNLTPFVFGVLFVGTLRFIAHVLSGTFAFAAYAEGQNPFLFSLLYNSYVFVDILLVAFVGAILFRSKSFSIELQRMNGRAK